MDIHAADGIAGATHWQKDLFGNTTQKRLTLSNNSNQTNGLLSSGKVYQGEKSIYNADNQLVKKVNQKGHAQTYAYDDNGQLKRMRDFANNRFSY